MVPRGLQLLAVLLVASVCCLAPHCAAAYTIPNVVAVIIPLHNLIAQHEVCCRDHEGAVATVWRLLPQRRL